MKYSVLMISGFLMLAPFLSAQSIADKKAMMHDTKSDFDPDTARILEQINFNLLNDRKILKGLYSEVQKLFDGNADIVEYRDLIIKIQDVKKAIAESENIWRERASSVTKEETYSLWSQPDTTLAQLIMDYGSSDYVYLFSPELSSVRLSVSSSLAIPRESWEQMLEHILSANGIGVRQLNPYLRELYYMNESSMGVKYVTNKKEDLQLYSPKDRVVFFLSGNSLEPRESLALLERFSDSQQIFLHTIGRDILIVGRTESVLELLKVYDFVDSNHESRDYRVVSLRKVAAKEMKELLETMFYGSSGAGLTPEASQGTSVRMMALSGKSLFLVGSSSEVEDVENIVRDIEGQVTEAQEKIVHIYNVKHSEPEEVAKVLGKVYPLMVSSGSKEPISQDLIDEIYSEWDEEEKKPSKHDSFIVDAKTGSIIMVIDKIALPGIASLLKKIDIPKKMVRIEVLLVEKRIRGSNHFGLNILNLGGEAASSHSTGLSWNGAHTDASPGILSFLMSRKKADSGIPAFDLAYRFLLSQNDVQVNASPSVTTVNQTKATIKIVDEISISDGAYLERTSESSEAAQNKFSRHEYGIVIDVTPTVHLKGDDMEQGDLDSITLMTDIQFDSTAASESNRPDVTKRTIKNEVRIPDGQTVIIGGLRRKNTTDMEQKIPFLGELPGVGKLFGTTDLTDDKTEMFIFLTPKIIEDPKRDFESMRYQELRKRPGDIPEFLQALEEAHEREKNRLFKGTMTMLFGPPADRVVPKGEFDGR